MSSTSATGRLRATWQVPTRSWASVPKESSFAWRRHSNSRNPRRKADPGALPEGLDSEPGDRNRDCSPASPELKSGRTAHAQQFHISLQTDNEREGRKLCTLRERRMSRAQPSLQLTRPMSERMLATLLGMTACVRCPFQVMAPLDVGGRGGNHGADFN